MDAFYLLLIFTLVVIIFLTYSKYKTVLKINLDAKYKEENIELKKDLFVKNEKLHYLESLANKFESEKANIRINNEEKINVLKSEINNVTEKYKSEIYDLKNRYIEEKELIFQKGILKGKELSNYEIQIHPYQELKQHKKLLGSEDLLNVGYKYMMFINGVPCLNSHIEIFETISKKEINEEKVNNLLSKIKDLTDMVPNGNVKLVGNLAEFGKNLLNFKK